MDIKTAQAAIEAILFASGDPVPVERLADALEMDKQTVRKLAAALAEEVNSGGGGLFVAHLDDAYQLTARAEYASLIRRALEIRRNTPLSQAAMEALAVVAYSQPVTKGYIEEVRGVDCSGIVSTLLNRGLIEERGRLEVPGRPILYGTTENFLRCFGLATLKDLPEVRDGEESGAESSDDGKNSSAAASREGSGE